MFELLTYIFVLAGIQGILLFILLFTRKQNHSANLILGSGILVLSLDLFLSAAFMNRWYLQFPHLLGVNYAFPFFYGPIFYLYVRALTGREQGFPKSLFHFIPYLFIVLYMLPDFMLSSELKIVFINNLIEKQPLSYIIFDHIKPVHGIIYTLLTIKEVKDHNHRIKDSFSNIDRINLAWLKNLVTGMVIIWSIVALSVLIDDILNTSFSGYDAFIYFAISILVYSIGYIGLNQPEIFKQGTRAQAEACATIFAAQDLSYAFPGTKSADEENQPEQRYRKSGLSESVAEDIARQLIKLMDQEKPYLDTELTLRSLSDKLNVSPHNLSEVINTKLGQSFFDFVNRYRVEEFKKKLEYPELSNYNLLAIAMESGFNSKTSFNMIFKKYTQMTPSQYRAMSKDRQSSLTKNVS